MAYLKTCLPKEREQAVLHPDESLVISQLFRMHKADDTPNSSFADALHPFDDTGPRLRA
jgi:hypothetical protein